MKNLLPFVTVFVLLLIRPECSAVASAQDKLTNLSQPLSTTTSNIVIDSFKQIQLVFNDSLLNPNIVPQINMCNDLNTIATQKTDTKLLCSAYLDMVYGLHRLNDSTFKQSQNITLELSKYNETKISNNFCESFINELPLNEDLRPFTKYIFPEKKNLFGALKTLDKCEMYCRYTDADTNIRIQPICGLTLSGFKQISNVTMNRTKSTTVKPLQNSNDSNKTIEQKGDKSEQSSKIEVKPSTSANKTVNITQNSNNLPSSIVSSSVNARNKEIEKEITRNLTKKSNAQSTVQPNLNSGTDFVDQQGQEDPNGQEEEDQDEDHGMDFDTNLGDRKLIHSWIEMLLYYYFLSEAIPTQNPIPDNMKKPTANIEKPKESKSKIMDDYAEQLDEQEIRPANHFEPLNMNHDISDDGSNFFSYLMFLMLLTCILYVVYHNKTKVLALVIEGRRGRRYSRSGGRRKHSAEYRRLDSNLEEAIQSSGQVHAAQIIY